MNTQVVAPVEMGEGWKKMMAAATHAGHFSIEMLRLMIDAILALIRRIAAIFGVESRPSPVKDSAPLDAQMEAEFVGEADAVANANKALQGPLAAMVRGFAEAAPNLTELDGKDAEAFLKDVLSHFEAHLGELKLHHAALTAEFSPLLLAAGKSAGVNSLEEAYTFLNDKDSRLVIDPKGELNSHIDQITLVEDGIKNVQQALCSYCAAAFARGNLKPIAEAMLQKEGFSDLHERVKNMAIAQNPVETADNASTPVVKSHNNLFSIVKPLVTQKERLEETTSGFLSATAPPVGVSRWKNMDKSPVGDMSEFEGGTRLGMQPRESAHD